MSPNGILSKSDKEYLASKASAESSDQWTGDEAQKRLRIRKKIQAAIRDFPLLSGFPRKEYELIFQDLNAPQTYNLPTIVSIKYQNILEDESNPQQHIPDDQYQGLLHMLAFIYNACRLEPTIEFERFLERAILMGEKSWREEDSSDIRIVDEVNATININYRDQPDIEAIKAKLASGIGLTRSEIGELYLEGELDDLELSISDLDPDIQSQKKIHKSSPLAKGSTDEKESSNSLDHNEE